MDELLPVSFKTMSLVMKFPKSSTQLQLVAFVFAETRLEGKELKTPGKLLWKEARHKEKVFKKVYQRES